MEFKTPPTFHAWWFLTFWGSSLNSKITYNVVKDLSIFHLLPALEIQLLTLFFFTCHRCQILFILDSYPLLAPPPPNQWSPNQWVLNAQNHILKPRNQTYKLDWNFRLIVNWKLCLQCTSRSLNNNCQKQWFSFHPCTWCLQIH